MIELVPHGRDKKDKEMYVFMHWFCRRYKKEIKTSTEAAILLMSLMGEEYLDEVYDKVMKERKL